MPPGSSSGRGPGAARPHANKQCLSFPAPMLQEIEQEAARLDRSVSWVVQRAWRLAREELSKIDPA
jgi:uncharacterized small protein (TIGR04563 family)